MTDAKRLGYAEHFYPNTEELVAPRLAAIFHFFNDFDTAPEIEAAVRRHYQGRLTLAKDFLVVNVTKDDIVVREAAVSSHVWPNKIRHAGFAEAERKPRMKMSKWLAEKQIFPKF